MLKPYVHSHYNRLKECLKETHNQTGFIAYSNAHTELCKHYTLLMEHLRDYEKKVDEAERLLGL